MLYADALIDPEPTSLTNDDVQRMRWAHPVWAAGDQVRAAACAWVIQSERHTTVVDPAGNIDDILHDPEQTAVHQEAFCAAFEESTGIAVDSVDLVLLSHVESVGFTAVRDGDSWRPFFPHSRVVVSERAPDGCTREQDTDLVRSAFGALEAAGRIGRVADDQVIDAGVRVEWTGAHHPDHLAFHIGPHSSPMATFVGHLAVTPLHLGLGPCAGQHPEPERAWTILMEYASDGRVLIGPLWPTPGAGRWDGERVDPL